jgi:hypothetical protein
MRGKGGKLSSLFVAQMAPQTCLSSLANAADLRLIVALKAAALRGFAASNARRGPQAVRSRASLWRIHGTRISARCSRNGAKLPKGGRLLTRVLQTCSHFWECECILKPKAQTDGRASTRASAHTHTHFNPTTITTSSTTSTSTSTGGRG